MATHGAALVAGDERGEARPAPEVLRTVLKRFRVAAGLSQAELAGRSGLSVQAISALERGARRRPHLHTLAALAGALGLSGVDRSLLLGTGAGEPAATARREAAPAVAQLPRDIDDLTGRETELRDVLAALAPPGAPRATPVVALAGAAGVGKSALAVHAAHLLRDRYPGGQLYVDLQGATPGLAPLAPLDALGRMLRALGVEPDAIPAEADEAAALLRSVTAGRRLLVLLDDARDARQVAPLLPGDPGCGVLVTSRIAPAALARVRTLDLRVLPEGDALALLGRIAGAGRVEADPAAAGEVVRACGCLPLALRLAGVRLAARPAWSIRDLRDLLADAGRRLDSLQAGGLALRASFAVSLQALLESDDPLDRSAGAAFGLVAAAGVPDLGVEAAARLLDLPPPAARDLVERLVDARLLEAPRPGRYRLHDLVRLYGREQAAGGLAPLAGAASNETRPGAAFSDQQGFATRQ